MGCVGKIDWKVGDWVWEKMENEKMKKWKNGKNMKL